MDTLLEQVLRSPATGLAFKTEPSQIRAEKRKDKIGRGSPDLEHCNVRWLSNLEMEWRSIVPRGKLEGERRFLLDLPGRLDLHWIQGDS